MSLNIPTKVSDVLQNDSNTKYTKTPPINNHKNLKKNKKPTHKTKLQNSQILTPEEAQDRDKS